MARKKTSTESKTESNVYRFSRHGNLTDTEKDELNMMEKKLSTEIEDLENKIKESNDLKTLKILTGILDNKRRFYYALSKRPKQSSEEEQQESLLNELRGLV
jgi:hypothetical protein